MNLADTPTTWVDPTPVSTLHALLFFGGIPLLIIAVITLLVMAPSLAKGPRYRLGQQWDVETEWFGSPASEAHGVPTGALEASSANRRTDDAGGASASW